MLKLPKGQKIKESKYSKPTNYRNKKKKKKKKKPCFFHVLKVVFKGLFGYRILLKTENTVTKSFLNV